MMIIRIYLISVTTYINSNSCLQMQPATAGSAAAAAAAAAATQQGQYNGQAAAAAAAAAAGMMGYPMQQGS